MKIGNSVICPQGTISTHIEIGTLYIIEDVNDYYLKVKGVSGYHPRKHFELMEQKSNNDTGCSHEWKAISGLSQTWYNCKHCDIKKEDYEKQSKEKSTGSSFVYPDYDDWF